MTIGLTSEEARARLVEFGRNTLPQPRMPNVFLVFFRQFFNPLIYILLIAAAVSLSLGQFSDAAFILLVLVINASVGTFQEHSAEKAALSLQRVVPAFATVIRDGKLLRLEAEYIVPGDSVLLASGDKVPADIQLFETRDLSVDESLLTGESMPVTKRIGKAVAAGAALSERLDRVFAGTMVTRGRGRGVVTATGLHTELGNIAHSVIAPRMAKPPLLQRMEQFTLRISFAMLVLSGVLCLVAWYQGGKLAEVFLIAVALAVSAIPEGLPAAMTVALAIGMRRMAGRNVIIRNLLAVESLGSCTFIASDKTGTLTVNELTVRKLMLPDGTHFDVTGEGTIPGGRIMAVDGFTKRDEERMARLCRTGILANEASLGEDGKHEGDMVDVAFLVLGRKNGQHRDVVLKDYPPVANIPYESEKGYSASLHRYGKKKYIFVKGSPEKLIAMCSHMLTEKGVKPINRKAVEHQMEQLAKVGYRILALADGVAVSDAPAESLHDLTLLGLAGMMDPLRSEAREAVDLCKAAGIEVAMITGDHPVTARAIAHDLGLCAAEACVVTGQDIKHAVAKGYAALDRLVGGSRVFARIEPAQKRQIVESLMRLGHFVAVTGDGVNDAPALRHAHVGVAMGKRGTDVARESADLIITDDDFASIVKGVHEGRIVYNNIRKLIFLLLATGGGEIVLFILALLAGLPMPLLAVQLLWLNLVTNGIQDVALACEPAEGHELKLPPRRPSEPVFDRLMLSRLVMSAVIMGGAAFAVYGWLLHQGYALESARNLTLLLMVLFENILIFNSRSERLSIFRQPFFSNPFLLVSIVVAQGVHIAAMYAPGLRDVLQVAPVTLMEWASLLLIAVLLLAAGEAQKRVWAKVERWKTEGKWNQK